MVYDLLMLKLMHCDIPGNALVWFKSNVHEQIKIFTYNDVNPTVPNIVRGVPQGSISGPLLFSLYVNDLPSPGRRPGPWAKAARLLGAPREGPAPL